MTKQVTDDASIHVDDFRQLCNRAKDALRQAMSDGIKKGYGPGHWKTVSLDEHLEHARWHASCLNPTTEDVEHAVCRLLMAYALMIGEKGEERR